MELKSDHFFVKNNSRYEKINYRDILWIKAEKRHVFIRTLSKNYFVNSKTLSELLKKTTNAGLLRIHRSYAINTDHVEALEDHCVIIKHQYIPIGKNYQTAIKQHFNLI